MSYQKHINKLIKFILDDQQPDGSFLSLSSADKEFKVFRTYRTTFTTSLIISLLSQLPKNPAIETALKKGTDYLLAQKSPQWSWNYWDKDGNEAKINPYPDDLDDTFCALIALSHAARAHIDGKAFSMITQMLIRCESAPGGPYKTWLVASDQARQWSDVDIAVNCNIAYFLKRERISLRGLDEYIEHAIELGKLSSRYYPSPYPIIFYLSRYYTGKYVPLLVALLEKKASHELDEALRITSLLNLGVSPHKIQSAVAELSKQIPQARPFCIDPSKNNRIMYNGSKALTAAHMCLALFLYEEKTTKKQDAAFSTEEMELVSAVRKKATDRISRLPSELKNSVISLLDTTAKSDLRHEIMLLPYWWNVSLGRKTDRTCAVLGVINLFGWIAYRIYDDMLDSHLRSGKFSDVLPIANILHTEILIMFQEAVPKKYWSIFTEIMKKLEYANFWEQRYCRLQVTENKISLKRLPHFGDLSIIADKSMGHALGPITLSHMDKSEQTVAMTKKFFSHYLIARQLNDDAHDWKNDLEKGCITPVNCLLLKDWKKSHRGTQLNLANDMKKLEKLFWNKTITSVSRDIFKHITTARAILTAINPLSNPFYLHALLDPLESAAQKALTERQKILDFVDSYKK